MIRNKGKKQPTTHPFNEIASIYPKNVAERRGSRLACVNHVEKKLPVSIPKIKYTRKRDTDNKSEFMARLIPQERRPEKIKFLESLSEPSGHYQ